MATRRSESEKVAADVEKASAPDASPEEVAKAAEEVTREVSGAEKLALLQAKASGAALPVDSNPVTPTPELPDPKSATVVDAGGDVEAQVLFARYNWFDGARVRFANRGEVVKVSEKLADHGEKIRALRRV